jgi:hypothetical protein
MTSKLLDYKKIKLHLKFGDMNTKLLLLQALRQVNYIKYLIIVYSFLMRMYKNEYTIIEIINKILLHCYKQLILFFIIRNLL